MCIVAYKFAYIVYIYYRLPLLNLYFSLSRLFEKVYTFLDSGDFIPQRVLSGVLMSI